MAGPAIGGTASLRIGDRVAHIKGSAKIMLGKPVREVLVGATGVAGYKKIGSAPSLEFEEILSSDLTLEELSNIESETISWHGNDGRVVTFEQAWQDGELQLDSEEMTVALVFKSMFATESAAS
jgi:hypothetical protein